MHFVNKIQFRDAWVSERVSVSLYSKKHLKYKCLLSIGAYFILDLFFRSNHIEFRNIILINPLFIFCLSLDQPIGTCQDKSKETFINLLSENNVHKRYSLQFVFTELRIRTLFPTYKPPPTIPPSI